jgi:hypothetical protein
MFPIGFLLHHGRVLHHQIARSCGRWYFFTHFFQPNAALPPCAQGVSDVCLLYPSSSLCCAENRRKDTRQEKIVWRCFWCLPVKRALQTELFGKWCTETPSMAGVLPGTHIHDVRPSSDEFLGGLTEKLCRKNTQFWRSWCTAWPGLFSLCAAWFHVFLSVNCPYSVPWTHTTWSWAHSSCILAMLSMLKKRQHVCPSWSCCMYRYMGEIFFFAQIIPKPINEYELDPQDVFAHVFWEFFFCHVCLSFSLPYTPVFSFIFEISPKLKSR